MNSPVLRRLRDLPTFEMAAGDPDVRGWTVRGSDGQSFGTVHELLVDLATQAVCYLTVQLDHGLPGVPPPPAHTEHQILLPVAAVNLDAEGSNVFITSLRRGTVSSYPPFVDFMLPPDFEDAMRRALEAPNQEG